MDIVNLEALTTDPIAFLSTDDARVYVLRLDKVHNIISGNKWFKLRFFIQDAIQQNKDTIVTFGGAYSNHIIATAAACRIYSLKSIGVIRGETPKIYSSTLSEAAALGMKFYFVDRNFYRNKKIPFEIDEQRHYIIPEGGYGAKGAEGAASISYKKSQFNVVCCAVGTGTTMAGLINSRGNNAEVLGISVLKNNFSITNEIKYLLNDKDANVKIDHNFHFGGYAKSTPELFNFMNWMYETSGIPTDFVYTGKLFYGVKKLIADGHFPKKSSILVIHSGGLQGNLSLRKGTLIF